MSLYCDVVFAEQLITTCALSTPQASSSQKKEQEQEEQEQEEKKGGKNIGKQARGGERLKAFLFILLETSSNTKPTITTFKAFETRGSGIAFSQKKKRLTLVKQNINHSTYFGHYSLNPERALGLDVGFASFSLTQGPPSVIKVITQGVTYPEKEKLRRSYGRRRRRKGVTENQDRLGGSNSNSPFINYISTFSFNHSLGIPDFWAKYLDRKLQIHRAA
ncbi:hypothetical protein TWF173_009246 [Orbilia oligospora]|nr:hypothetical protein TWF173_009246 [Orbilia oligospora]